MFARAAVSISAKHRASPAHFLSEIIATAGLLLVIFALARTGRSRTAPAAVGAYIGAAYFFTSSASFANPAITVGRMFSATFAGIAPSSAPVFIAAQVVGGAVGLVVIKLLYPRITPDQAATAVVPHLTQDAGRDGQPGHDGAPRHDHSGGTGQPTPGPHSPQPPARPDRSTPHAPGCHRRQRRRHQRRAPGTGTGPAI